LIIISHRGCLIGPDPLRENHPYWIESALLVVDMVEVDIWVVDNKLWLGHDRPIHSIQENFLSDIGIQSIIWHAKNPAALDFFIRSNADLHYFWHTYENYVFTSKGYVWTYCGNDIVAGERAVAVLPENDKQWDISSAAAVCTDYVARYMKQHNFPPS